MELLDCTEEDLKIYIREWNLKLTAWGSAWPEDICKIEIDGEIVALIEYSNGMYEEDSLHIHNFEVFNKGKGIGSKIIEEITKNLEGAKLYLYSNSKESTSFWQKCNFEFYDDGTGTPILCYSE